MARTRIVVDVNDQTGEVWRIIHPESDAHITNHKEEPGHTRHLLDSNRFQIDEASGKPSYSLHDIGDEIERRTGRRPVNTRRPA